MYRDRPPSAAWNLRPRGPEARYQPTRMLFLQQNFPGLFRHLAWHLAWHLARHLARHLAAEHCRPGDQFRARQLVKLSGQRPGPG